MEARKTSVGVYINDVMVVALQLPDFINLICNAVPLIIDAFFRKNSENEPLPRAAILFLGKLLVEGQLSPIKIILGW